MPLEIRVCSPEPTSLTLALDGKLDAVTAPDMETFVTKHLGDATTTLILDLEKLNFVSSAGLRIFAKLRKTMQSREGKLCFVNLSPQVQKVFEIVKAIPNSDVFRNLQELDDYLATMQRKVGEA